MYEFKLRSMKDFKSLFRLVNAHMVFFKENHVSMAYNVICREKFFSMPFLFLPEKRLLSEKKVSHVCLGNDMRALSSAW